jgi:phosphatidylserine/phosphatidylglycerophosphate/cardiolipin synthase-like enzyme
MANSISTTFLRDVQHGGAAGQLEAVASQLAAFVTSAKTSVDVAIYDFRLSDATAVTKIVGALVAAADRGVAVRVAFDAGKPTAGTAADFARLEADPAPVGTSNWVSEHFGGTKVLTKPIVAGGQLMHSKYVVRDATPGTGHLPAVWTGSTNFTDDAWSRQENNVIVVSSAAMATSYRHDFDQMWTAGKISGTGKAGSGKTSVGSATVAWDFCPGDGAAINTALAARVAAATQRLIIATMVLTSHEVLAALSKAVDDGIALTGIYDGGQMDPIVKEWKKSNSSALADWTKVSAKLVHKQSAPYTPAGTHNFMHLKVLISDGVVTTGSYNFSANAEKNAENQLHLDDATVVAHYETYLDAVIVAYS